MIQEPIQIPTKADIKLGDTLEHDGKQLIADAEYTSGNDFRKSGLKYYMISPKGVTGFKEA